MELIVSSPSTDDTLKVEINLKLLVEQNDALKAQNKELVNKIAELEERLKKYTNGSNHKRYYEKNKEKIKESGSNYLQKLKIDNPDKIKEYSRRAYENKKKKKLESIIANSIGENIIDTTDNSSNQRIDERAISPIPIIV